MMYFSHHLFYPHMKIFIIPQDFSRKSACHYNQDFGTVAASLPSGLISIMILFNGS